MDSRMKGARILKDRNRTCAAVLAVWYNGQAACASLRRFLQLGIHFLQTLRVDTYTKQILQNMAWEQVKL